MGYMVSYWINVNVLQDFESSDGPLMNLLMEAYLDQWKKNKDTDVATKEKLLALLTKAQDCPSWDWARALFACKMVPKISLVFSQIKSCSTVFVD